MTKPASPSIVRAKRPPRVLICAKCVRKLDGGRAVRKALKAGLAESAEATGQRAGRLVETKCMGLCPKRAVTLASGATLVRGELLMVARPEDASAVLAMLLG